MVAPGISLDRLAASDGGPVTVVVGGEVDIASAELLEQALGREEGQVVADLCAVTFMDSSGLRALLLAGRRLAAGGGGLSVVCNQDGQVEALLRLTQLDDALQMSTRNGAGNSGAPSERERRDSNPRPPA